jgi:uncharacterized phage-associated protein
MEEGTKMITINDAADYIILKLDAGGEAITNLKLQKLLYYVQAWHIALHEEVAFPGRFQAWIHGPVSRTVYNRFCASKSLYSEITVSDITPGFNPEVIDQRRRFHIDRVLDAYAAFSGSELEEMTHNEEPWRAARQGYRPSERCEVDIDETVMGSCYRQRLN